VALLIEKKGPGSANKLVVRDWVDINMIPGELYMMPEV